MDLLIVYAKILLEIKSSLFTSHHLLLSQTYVVYDEYMERNLIQTN